ncbi:hypothetical protein GPALN_011502 [Globodera pallida]|nr:hypothetical protein GPALN_011502 [Globodera pallida]
MAGNRSSSSNSTALFAWMGRPPPSKVTRSSSLTGEEERRKGELSSPAGAPSPPPPPFHRRHCARRKLGKVRYSSANGWAGQETDDESNDDDAMIVLVCMVVVEYVLLLYPWRVVPPRPSGGRRNGPPNAVRRRVGISGTVAPHSTRQTHNNIVRPVGAVMRVGFQAGRDHVLVELDATACNVLVRLKYKGDVGVAEFFETERTEPGARFLLTGSGKLVNCDPDTRVEFEHLLAMGFADIISNLKSVHAALIGTNILLLTAALGIGFIDQVNKSYKPEDKDNKGDYDVYYWKFFDNHRRLMTLVIFGLVVPWWINGFLLCQQMKNSDLKEKLGKAKLFQMLGVALVLLLGSGVITTVYVSRFALGEEKVFLVLTMCFCWVAFFAHLAQVILVQFRFSVR